MGGRDLWNQRAIALSLLSVMSLGCHAAASVPGGLPAECSAVSVPAAAPQKARIESLEERSSELLARWLDAQQRGDVQALRSLYAPCFEGPEANRDARRPEWITEHQLLSGRRQHVSLVEEAPFLAWSSDVKNLPDPQAWIVTAVRRSAGPQGSMIRVWLKLGWFPDGPRITRQRDIWLTDWEQAEDAPPERSFPPRVRASCELCPTAKDFPHAALLRDCQRRCEAGTDADPKEACWLLARAHLLGECGVTQDRERGLRYVRPEDGDTGPGDTAFAVARELIALGGRENLVAALRTLACLPERGKMPRHCSRSFFVSELLWNTGEPSLMKTALDHLDEQCQNARSCGEDDAVCTTAIRYQESGKAGPPDLQRIKQYRFTLETRLPCPAEER